MSDASVDADAEAYCARVEAAIAANRPGEIGAATLSRVLQTAIRAYAFKTEKAGHYLEPYEKGSLTATETVMAATAIIRAADLNLWDVAMWFNRAGSAPARDDAGR